MTQPPTMAHQSQRCERGACAALSKFVIIGRFPPVWITPYLSVNDSHTGHLATGLSDQLVDLAANGVVVARSEVGVVGVQTLHAA